MKKPIIQHWTEYHELTDISSNSDMTSFRGTSDGDLPTDEEEEGDEGDVYEGFQSLLGAVDDDLIPNTFQIHNAYWEAYSLWKTYLVHAQGYSVKLNSSSLLQAVPPMPHKLPPKGIIRGRSCWDIELLEFSDLKGDEPGNPKEADSPWGEFSLSTGIPVNASFHRRMALVKED